ncbi:cellulose biosynthesis cyclic di-GMP-binding regulatory protein BcsB [Erwiniaceae bacterium BAC15a-03b]|uniref:Cyclic di-GMP-binding protein n=1 Tax=Winslowiella arboricola TaxID=2978220 RepID=A0A9J6PPY6_9GAMM|nr:cellulose biosynthesis cyclic di-GMP-binding regulatory protein BcsB [Winslowiella arboricola]MCU5773839.1 cellulose biosynthesis cyclic di-GMP-binding regulatory protein BcsB [Winslowiella arboricola]MCU5777749.1 cellulose biosynthesis cyclic di-GMP-binding regulatory protein BcsB [Winslowiella arboricola]
MKQLFLRTMLATLISGSVTLGGALAADQSVTQDSAALSQLPAPSDVGAAENSLRSTAGATPYAPESAPADNSQPQEPISEEPPAEIEGGESVAADAAPGLMQPPVASDAPVMAFHPISSSVTVAQMGQQNGVMLSGGQLQSGIVFTLPTDQVITNARLDLALRVSPALAARNTSIQLMLNGQPLGTLPLNASDSDTATYQLDIPAAMVVSSNNLSFKINDADQLLCERDSAEQYQVVILPQTRLSLEGQQLNTGTSMRNFPRPFIDPLQMTGANVTMVFPSTVTPGQITAAAMVSSWMGIQADYRGATFPVLRNQLPEKNGIVYGQPGEKIGNLTLPVVNGPTLQLVDNPDNPTYKLMLVIGKDEDQLRQAAYRLIKAPLMQDASTLNVTAQTIPVRKPYDAPRWINTDRPVRLAELLRKDQSLTTNGIWHDALRVNFRAAPDLFLWDGDSIPVQLNYRFPAEGWIDENNSSLNVTLNGTFLRNLTVNKVGLLENIWHRLGGDARQESYALKLEPYLIYGDNQLQLYFNIKPKADAPCSVLLNNNIKSRIEDNSSIDLSNTRHFTLLPNLSYFVGASFPFSRMADFSQTVLMMPEKPSDAEISALLDMAGRAGNATGVTLDHNSVMFGIPAGGSSLERLKNSDVLAISTMGQSAFNQAMLVNSPYDTTTHTFGVKAPTTLDNLRSWLTGDWYRKPLDADRYFSSNESWRGFVSYRSPWSEDHLVVMTIASSDQQLLSLHNDLNSPRINAGIRGDTAIITDENGIRSFRVGPQFPSGQMPWYMMIVWYANQHSVLLALCALLLSIIVGGSAYVMLKRHAWKRLHKHSKDDSSGEQK